MHGQLADSGSYDSREASTNYTIDHMAKRKYVQIEWHRVNLKDRASSQQASSHTVGFADDSCELFLALQEIPRKQLRESDARRPPQVMTAGGDLNLAAGIECTGAAHCSFCVFVCDQSLLSLLPDLNFSLPCECSCFFQTSCLGGARGNRRATYISLIKGQKLYTLQKVHSA